MIQSTWVQESRKTVICIDSYDNGIPIGRIYNASAEPQTFESLTQFLIKMETMLDELQTPQSYTSSRNFGAPPELPESAPPMDQTKRGKKATFDLQVIFRQHRSWQGPVNWLEQRMEHSFRSVLELILLMDSALRKQE